MKIAISIQEADIHAAIDAHFGRCRNFCIVDTLSGGRTLLDNAAGADSTQGAGFHAVEAVARLGAEAVITGQLGPKAESALRAAGIKAYRAENGTVDDALALLKAQKLTQLA
jgi:predicted Fe-Mo cluster-binding NifX family protein